ncbi:MAG: hypothetical protein KDC92_06710 [Bacteroidetes bacterium]|nr:hypothetical protein [Bacteroidota bacterium]
MRYLLLLFAFIVFLGSKAQQTPFETGNGNTTATYDECIKFYRDLDAAHKTVKMYSYGQTDAGKPLHLVVVANKELPGQGLLQPFIKKEKETHNKAVFLVMNGIHPGEPCGIDASMMLARDLAKSKSKMLDDIIVCFIPVYNVGGMLNRDAYSRANQDGPEEHGFRGNAQNLDLNRDFIKADSKNTWAFWELFHEWKPDVFLDNHTTNGSDHQYTMTLITSQKDKQNEGVKDYLQTMEPMLYSKMKERGDEMSPYINVHGEPVDDHFEGFLETPRYSTGYTTLFGTVSFVAEAHMLKQFKDRVNSTYRLMEVFLETIKATKFDLMKRHLKTITHENQLKQWPIYWELDKTKFETINFKGFEAEWSTSPITGQKRYTFNHDKPFTKEIKFYNTYLATKFANKPFAYIIPQGQNEVIVRLKANHCLLRQLSNNTKLQVQYSKIIEFDTRKQPYEGHYQHFDTKVEIDSAEITFQAGDYVLLLPNRFAIETLEHEAHDAFFNWNFFDSYLQQKEWFSSYVFEDMAVEILENDAELKTAFETKKANDENFKNSAFAQLYYIYQHSPYYEEEHMRMPVFKLMEMKDLNLY